MCSGYLKFEPLKFCNFREKHMVMDRDSLLRYDKLIHSTVVMGRDSLLRYDKLIHSTVGLIHKKYLIIWLTLILENIGQCDITLWVYTEKNNTFKVLTYNITSINYQTGCNTSDIICFDFQYWHYSSFISYQF